MIGRIWVVVIGALLLGLVSVPAASAKVYFSGVPETAAPGTVVNAFVSGCEAAPACGPFVRGASVFVARAAAGRLNFNVPPNPRWLVGKATPKGKLDFKMPKVREGRYRLIARLKFGKKLQYLPASNVFTIQAPEALPPGDATQ